jgi:hypothetical protein
MPDQITEIVASIVLVRRLRPERRILDHISPTMSCPSSLTRLVVTFVAPV